MTKTARPGHNAQLAVDGGQPVRTTPMPPREAFGNSERKMLNEALDHYASIGVDPGYQGIYEQRYCTAFSQFMGGGYADAVATGTAALFVALAALNLPKGSEVVVSPITDPGTLSAVILNGLVPVLADSKQDSYNVGVEEIECRTTDRTSCILVVHSIGQAADIERICAFAEERNLRVLEDCSQSHGAMVNGRPVGVFGDIAAFSTMYRKTSISGGCGGVVYSRDEEIYHNALAHADRGKPAWREDFDDRNPELFLGPALNFHTDELSCAIGVASLARLDETRRRRLAFARSTAAELDTRCRLCRAYPINEGDSPFVFPVFVDPSHISVSKIEFARAVIAEGIGLNPHYRYLVADWPWIRPYLAGDVSTPNAKKVRDETFNLYLNEVYGEQEVSDVVEAITKVESAYMTG